MMRTPHKASELPPRHSVTAPLDVFYVVETTGEVSGERHHRVHPPLFETRKQAHDKLAHVQVTNAPGTFSIWKGTTYVEPAGWSYDVEMADGTVIRSGRRSVLPGGDPRLGTVSCA
jgi:hypothetical protein